MIRIILIVLFLTICSVPARAQSFGEYLGDESVLYAQTKQVNQFFRRFNGEESVSGIRYYERDSLYRNPNFRHRYLNVLFDLENHSVGEKMRKDFVEQVTKRNRPNFLNFHAPGWFAEVSTKFIHHGSEVKVILFLKLEQENLGYKWVITDVFYKPFNDLLASEDDGNMLFLHPMSHELDFMNLIKVFQDKDKIAKYASKGFKPNYLTLLLYEIKRGNMKFQTVENVKFHFFQVPGWYFELSDLRRTGYNAGWLITGLIPISETEKELLLKYIYHD
ncbi:MAG: hypothetical protein U1C46_08740 [Bacteroidales bacterium]|nr:hypothetical protein [Bacteroidales bacterium]MDZ4204889.1 hypothetical protein [Bacteroidales bacterium]